MTLSISYVKRDSVDALWDIVGPILQRAVQESHDRYTVADLRSEMIEGKIQLFIVKDERDFIIAANTITFNDYPQMRVLTGLYIAGDRLVEWKDAMCKVIEEIAHNTDCRQVEFVGRMGWRKVLEPNGYEPAFCTYLKVIG